MTNRAMLHLVIAAAVGLFALGSGRASAQTLASPPTDCAETVSTAPLYPGAPAGPFGVAVKRPVFGGACKVCPWGAVAEIVRDAMKPYGWDVQICYHCARADAPRIVAGAKKPPPWKTGFLPGAIIDSDIPPPPDAPVDFGATSVQNLKWAYEGSHTYAGEGPRRNLRLIATIQAPNWLIVAVRHGSGITDLAQLKDRPGPLHVLADDATANAVLAWYGLDRKAIEAKGGWVKSSFDPPNRKDFDVVIAGGSLGNAPEFNVWYEVSQRYDLDYLALPDALLDKLARDNDMFRQDIPDGLLRGVHRRIPTVARTGHTVYTRDDVPEAFAYAVAKALDEQQQLFQWSHINLSYNVHTVAQAGGVPLHPGAARYYRERGYLPRASSPKPAG
jgi:TRAP transporter TAXI family solute receptor